MKSFRLLATNLNDVAAVINKLTPSQNAGVFTDVDAIEANRLAANVEKILNDANDVFLKECQNTLTQKTSVVDRYQKEYAMAKEGLSDKKEKELGARLTGQMRTETTRIDNASKANELAQEYIEVRMEEADYDHLKKLLPATVNGWVGSEGQSCRDLLLKVADAIGTAKDV